MPAQSTHVVGVKVGVTKRLTTRFLLSASRRFLRMPFVDKLPAIAEVAVVRQEFDLNNAVETKKPQVAPQH